MVAVIVRYKTLERSDRDRLELLGQYAFLLTEEFVLANAAADSREWVRFENYLVRTCEVLHGNPVDERLDVGVDRACWDTFGRLALKAAQRLDDCLALVEADRDLVAGPNPLFGIAYRQHLTGRSMIPLTDSRGGH